MTVTQSQGTPLATTNLKKDFPRHAGFTEGENLFCYINAEQAALLTPEPAFFRELLTLRAGHYRAEH